MIANKHITKMVAVIVAIAVCFCFIAMAFSDRLTEAAGGTGVSMEYESELFDTSEPISVNIIMSSEDWDTMLANASSEEYYQCDVEVNGEMFYSVAIRPKGNTSLSSIVNDPDTDRFSLKLEFDQYVDGQTCFGLDKLVLNNNFADATNMKEALIYDMYQYLGVDASLYNFAKISVNDEYWGVYLALEAVEDSFLLRNYGVESGELYKPDSMEIGGGMGDNENSDSDASQFEATKPDGFDASQFEGTMPENFDASQFEGTMPEDFDVSQFGGMTPPTDSSSDKTDSSNGTDSSTNTQTRPGRDNSDVSSNRGGASMSGSGANLNYTDDELDSYSTIWDSEITGSSTSDHERVVTALKNISEGTDLEEYMDVDNLLKYMAVHVFSVNDDSLSGSMAHNYYLYEYNGQLNLLPWDYNLAFGGMGGGSDATSMINDAIDGAFSGTEFFDTLMENEEYEAQYYAYLQQLVDEYINGGAFEEFYNRTRSQIDSLVETDPTAFYTYDEYTEAVEMLYEVVMLRGESIDGQLNGSIPSTADEQRSTDALIDASHLDLSVMGNMSSGGSMGGGFNIGTRNQNRATSTDEGTATEESTDVTATASSEAEATITLLAATTDSTATDSDSTLPSETMPEGFTGTPAEGEQPSGTMPEGFAGTPAEGEPPTDFDPSQSGGQAPADFDPSQSGGQAPGSITPSGETETTVEDATPSEEDANSDVAAATDSNTTVLAQSNGQSFNPSAMGFGSGETASLSTQMKNLITYGICFGILMAALVFAMLYRRKSRRHR